MQKKKNNNHSIAYYIDAKHDLVKKRLSITRIFCLSITKIKMVWRGKAVTNDSFTHLKIAINLYKFGILTNK